MIAIDNSLSEYLYALKKDAPGKVWWNADFENRAPIYRQLRFDPADYGAAYAIVPFRIAKIEDKAVILAAHPTPDTLDPDPDWLNIETVFAWDPLTDTAAILSDDVPQLAGKLTDEAHDIYASPRTFFQAWAIRRATFFGRREANKAKDWHVAVREQDQVPGALLIGKLSEARINPFQMPEHIECHGIDPRELNRAILKAARLPRASAATSALRRAA